MATTSMESRLARAVLDAQAELAKCELSERKAVPGFTQRLEACRQREAAALDDWHAFRNGTYIPRRIG